MRVLERTGEGGRQRAREKGEGGRKTVAPGKRRDEQLTGGPLRADVAATGAARALMVCAGRRWGKKGWAGIQVVATTAGKYFSNFPLYLTFEI